jgi:DNA recombination protein RmuC
VGEIQLRNVIGMAGMVEHCDFTSQTTVHTDDGRLRPDVLVRLPGDKLVVVDSKVPLEAFLTAQEAKTDEERDAALAHHARQTREHITKLASKGYQSQFDTTPELVFMFVPSEGIYHAALAADPALLEYGVRQQVLLATPTTLIGLVRAIHYGWRQELIAESALRIAETGRDLHRRLAVFAEPLPRSGGRSARPSRPTSTPSAHLTAGWCRSSGASRQPAPPRRASRPRRRRWRRFRVG